MTTSSLLNDALAHHDGLVSTRLAPRLASAVHRAVVAGDLVPVVPTVFATPAAAPLWATRVRAISWWRPDAVFTRHTALAIHRRHDAEGPVTASCPSRVQTPGWCLFSRRPVPSQHVCLVGGMRVSSAATTALDLAAEDGGAAIDEMLRRRLTTYGQLTAVMEASRRQLGNVVRRRVLDASRAEPWSQLERVLHQVLWDEGLTGWTANLAVSAGGHDFFLDVVDLVRSGAAGVSRRVGGAGGPVKSPHGRPERPDDPVEEPK